MRGFGNSFQPAIDAPRLEPHKLRHCPKRKDALLVRLLVLFIVPSPASILSLGRCGTTATTVISQLYCILRFPIQRPPALSNKIAFLLWAMIF
ncbi:hypothetical protein D8674_041949 [Pyrus ussuriensis x Pyrus communis]|uniref:Uncharacterized protein n=1 Tax=Pyrus ussuriensis x Pyrus communis TaxID=2448454 RepID=A0A5N5G363_9ROSA|nr:hypothetical protein D8674_041949 [Pyrus ussuriensis x Pyrus communis]